jgi:hypothetical protein
MATLIVTDASIMPLVGASSGGDGAYCYDPIEGVAVTDTVTTTAQAIEAGHQVRMLGVADGSQFPDQAGWLCLGFGSDYQVEVPYLRRAGNQLLLDPTFTFEQAVPMGSSVNLLAQHGPFEPAAGDEGGFWLTASPAGRVACLTAIDDIVVGGYDVTKTVRYPGDVGLAGEGLLTHGQGRLNGAVEVWGGDDLDTEVELARED